MFHNNLWQCPLPVRLIAVSTTHLQMWRHLTPERLVSFSSYAVSLRTIHDVDYWATDAIPEDSRFYWKSFFRYSGQFRAEPLFIPVYGDAVRARSYPRSLVQQYLQIRRWAWGVTDIPFFIDNALAHNEIPLRDRISRLFTLWLDHINWAVAPFIIVCGPALAGCPEPDLCRHAVRAAAWRVRCLAPDRRHGRAAGIDVHRRPAGAAEAPRVGRLDAHRFVGAVDLSAGRGLLLHEPACHSMPRTRLLTGRYLEYRVTEKA